MLDLGFVRADLELVEEKLRARGADPAALLGDLPEEQTSQILQEMEPAGRKEISELLEYGHNTAAGRMNTDFVALGINATMQNAIEALRRYEGGVETLSTIYIVDSQGTLVGAVPLAKLVLADPGTPLLALTREPLISAPEDAKDQDVAELFDKYNLLTLPVVDEHKKLTGVITSDDVIAVLRAKL